MKYKTTIFLKIAVFLIGMTILCLCVFWLPWQSRVLAEMYPEFIHLQYPLLFGIYMTAIPFFFALYQALNLLTNIDLNKAFSDLSVRALKYIKYSAFSISFLYIVGFFLLISQNAGNPGILLLGLIITFISIVIAIFAALLQKLLKHAINIKLENDLLV
ncbi:DUF2975 domain-containing protein [Metabacillus litoralis]|uniref:DUF2975 domain-containing protein n=1 Tax=Metabacillus litoralis TaxID=152268 RepID=UPI001CFE0584|nr:DUF2975 domain-containing protein [Metabacillus litoralis]